MDRQERIINLVKLYIFYQREFNKKKHFLKTLTEQSPYSEIEFDLVYRQGINLKSTFIDPLLRILKQEGVVCISISKDGIGTDIETRDCGRLHVDEVVFSPWRLDFNIENEEAANDT